MNDTCIKVGFFYYNRYLYNIKEKRSMAKPPTILFHNLLTNMCAPTLFTL
ncbi:hypothetical protein Hdeb2414_s0007g00233701 [Helianthus debilis subsp. tardiflorus]